LQKIFGIFLIFIALNLQADLSPSISNYALFLQNQIRIEYKNQLKIHPEINPKNLPYIDCLSPCEQKNEEATYLLHGFMGSPNEMKYISEKAFNAGSVIFNDLIIGYGSTAKMANQFKKELWYKHAEKNLIFVFKNFKKVNLVGFSTGALLISHFLNNHPEYISQVGKIQLISPFYFPHFGITPIIGKLVSLFTDSINVHSFYKFTAYPDVEIMTLEPDYYLQDVPLKAALEVSDLAAQFVETAKKYEGANPIEIYLTENDQVLSYEKSQPFLEKIYPKAKLFLLKGKRLPHHLMSPMVSNEAIIIKNNF
jgi:esterase/lipase